MDGKRQYLAVSTAAEATQTRNTRMRRSSRKGDDFIEVGTHYETIGRHEEQHHTCFRNWANLTAASSPEKGWTSKQILREVNRYHNMQAAHVCFLVCRILTYLCFSLCYFQLCCQLRHAQLGEGQLDLSTMSVAKLMTALMNEHNGPQETNRV